MELGVPCEFIESFFNFLVALALSQIGECTDLNTLSLRVDVSLNVFKDLLKFLLRVETLGDFRLCEMASLEDAFGGFLNG